MSDFIGRQLGPYKLEEQLGRGGMATVYRAFQTTVKRYVAVKVMSPDIARDPGFVERFAREAELIASLQHPHILPVIDYGEADGTHYLVMRYIEGGSLDDRMRRQPLTLPESARLLDQISAALDYAHKRGVIHRDFKPNNVLLDGEENTYLTDFGIARLMDSSSHLTVTGTIMGTPAYMSPEQGTGRTVDARADLYSLGVVVYEMVTGRLPFSADTPASLIFQHAFQPPTPPQTFKPDIMPGVVAVIDRALAKNPDDRYQSGAELTRAFSSAIAGRAPESLSENKNLLVSTFVEPGTPKGTPPPRAATPLENTLPPGGANLAPPTIPPTEPPQSVTQTPPNAGSNARRSPALIIFALLAIVAAVAVGGGAFAINNANQNATREGETKVALLVLSATKTPTVTPQATDTPTFTATSPASATLTNTPLPSATFTTTADASQTLTAARLITAAANETATSLGNQQASITAIANLAASQIAVITRTFQDNLTGTRAALAATNSSSTLTAVASAFTRVPLTATSRATNTAVPASATPAPPTRTITVSSVAPSATRLPPTRTPSRTVAPTLTSQPTSAINANDAIQKQVDQLATDGYLTNHAGQVVIGPADGDISAIQQQNYYRFRSFEKVNIKDFVASTTFTWTNPGTDGECGIMARFSQTGTSDYRFYSILIGANGTFRIMARVGTEDRNVTSGDISGLNTRTGAANTLVVTVENDLLHIFLNGQFISSVTLFEFDDPGNVLVTGSTQSDTGIACSFKNFWVYDLNATPANGAANVDYIEGLNDASGDQLLKLITDAKLFPADNAQPAFAEASRMVSLDADKTGVFSRPVVGDATLSGSFVMTSDVAWGSDVTTTSCGLHFYGSRSPNNFITFYIYPTQAWYLDAQVNNQWLDKPLATGTSGAIQGERTAINRITLIVNESTLTVFVGNERVAQVRDLPLSSGNVGYYVGKGNQGGAENCTFTNTAVWRSGS